MPYLPDPASFDSSSEATNPLGALDFGATGGVVLGQFAFNGFEVPAQITFGGQQMMTVHRLPGGERVVDLMGPDEMDIDWTGTFLDNDPISRAQELDQIRVAGQPQPLVWGQNFYSVIVKSFQCDTRYSMVPYRISCLVIQNEAAAQAADQNTDDLNSASTDDMNSAVAAAPVDVQPAVLAAQTTVVGLGALALGGVAAQSALIATGQAMASVAALRGTTESLITGIATDGAAVGAPVATAAGLTSALAATGELAALLQTTAYLGRLSINLGGQPWV